jgi:hypothetical protein
MSYISLATVPPTTEAISRTGTENIFAELHFRRLGDEQIELRTILIDYSPFSGKYITDEISREVVEIEYAVDEAVDQECAARERLDALNALGWTDLGFGEAVERLVSGSYTVPAVAAE